MAKNLARERRQHEPPGGDVGPPGGPPRLVEVSNPTRLSETLADSLFKLALGSELRPLSEDEWCRDYVDSDGSRHVFTGTESVYACEWTASRPPVRETDRSRGRLGTPLIPRWWLKASRCARRHPAAEGWTLDQAEEKACQDGHCDSCRLKRVGRRTRDIRAASIPHLLRGAELLLVTTTRAPVDDEKWTSRPEDVARFVAANKVFSGQLQAAGALGGAAVLEARIHREAPGKVRCCDSLHEDHCPLCRTTGGMLPQAHLHMHHIVLVPRGWRIKYGWLQRLELPRAIDARWGTCDVSRGSTRKGGDSLGAYVGGYLARLKEASGLQTAWLRRGLGRSGRTLSSWGVLRAAARSGGTITVDGPADGSAVHVDLQRDILVRRREWQAGDVAARARDVARVLRSKGIECTGEWKATADEDQALYEFMRAWEACKKDNKRPRLPRWSNKRRARRQNSRRAESGGAARPSAVGAPPGGARRSHG